MGSLSVEAEKKLEDDVAKLASRAEKKAAKEAEQIKVSSFDKGFVIVLMLIKVS